MAGKLTLAWTPSPNPGPARTFTLAPIFALILTRPSHSHQWPATFTQTRTEPEERAACSRKQVDAVTFKSFMESPVSTDGALNELTNSLLPTSQCMRNITMCGLSAPRQK